MNRLFRVLAGLLLIIFASALWAADPPQRVARIQYVGGEVSVQPQGTNDWVQAVLNRPLTNSDNIWADKNSRAELNVGTGIFRIGAETSLTLANVGDNNVQLRLHQGALNLHVRKLYDGEVYEIDSPGLAFVVLKAGDYRFDVDSGAGATTVTVWRGEGDVTGEGHAVHLKAGQSARFSGDGMAHTISQSPKTDGFDDWCQARDERQDKSQSAKYVSQETIGSEDLDNNGHWETAPTYGNIWVPNVAVGWAPYRYGSWVWVAPWGWTWVDNAPWGFAPFHYGRWVYYNNYWAWAPGAYWARPVYSPALVAWFGGPGWGVSFGFGGVYGWAPLGWGEPFYPWYGVSHAYFHHVNYHVNNITVVSNNFFHGGHWGSFSNRNHPGGFTAMDGHALARGASVNSHMTSVPRGQLNRTASFGRQMPLRPTAESRVGAARGASGPPAQAASRGGFSGRSSGMNSSGNGMRANGPAPMRQGDSGSRTGSGNFGAGRSVPRPDSARSSLSGNRSSSGDMRSGSGFGGHNAATREVPHPPAGFNSRAGSSSGSSGVVQRGGDRSSRSFSGGRDVPRPTGPVLRNTAAEFRSGGYSSGSMGSESRGYGASSRSYGSSDVSGMRSSGSSSRYGSTYSGGQRSSGGGGYYSASRGSGSYNSSPGSGNPMGSYSGGRSMPSGGYSGSGGYRGGGGYSGGGHSSGGGGRSGGNSGGHSGSGGGAARH
jgi:hypothetical protein